MKIRMTLVPLLTASLPMIFARSDNQHNAAQAKRDGNERTMGEQSRSALDEMDEQTLGTRPSVAHLTARQEVETLLASLKLPIDERGRRRAEARAQWLDGADTPLELHDILVG